MIDSDNSLASSTVSRLGLEARGGRVGLLDSKFGRIWMPAELCFHMKVNNGLIQTNRHQARPKFIKS